MAQYEEFTIDKGVDVAIELDLINEFGDPKDLSNYNVAASMRRNYSSTQAVDFNSIIAKPPTDGVVTLSLTNAQTAALDAGRYVYDVIISFTDSDGNDIKERVLEGRFQVTPNVTGAV